MNHKTNSIMPERSRINVRGGHCDFDSRRFQQSAEALMIGDGIAHDHDRRLRDRCRAEIRSRLSALAIVVAAVLWLFL